MTTPISTSFMFMDATERMTRVQNELATTQTQLTEGKQVLKPSDAPDQASAIQRLRSEVEKQESFQRTINVAQRRFAAEEEALRTSFDVLSRFKELTIQANNDSASPSDRKVIAIELRSLREQLMSLANTRDDAGNYLFSGTRSKTPPYQSDGNAPMPVITYQGDRTQTDVPGGIDRTVRYTRTGPDVYVRVNQDGEEVAFFDALGRLITSIEEGVRPEMQRGMSDLEAMLDGVNVGLAQNGSDQAVIESQRSMLEATVLRMKSALSDIEDLDYTEAVTRMSQQSLALQAAQSSFAKISQLSLFNYIN